MIVSCQSLAMTRCPFYLQLLSSALIVSAIGQNRPEIGKAGL
jgi:hypothetical protein